MAQSKIGLCNMALAHIGASAISDLLEGSRESIEIGVFYDLAIDATLADFSWPFATKRLLLSRKAVNLSNHHYCYGLPFDCLVAQDILRHLDLDDPIVFETGNQNDERVLYTNHPNAVLVYTARGTDPSLFSPGFILASSLRLASLIALPITQNMDVAQRALQLYRSSLIEAETNAAREMRKQPRKVAEWTRRRIGGQSLAGE